MYKVLQIIEGTCEAHLSLDDSRLIMACISGQMYDSGPVNIIGDLGARFALHSSVRNVPGSSKLVSMVAAGCKRCYIAKLVGWVTVTFFARVKTGLAGTVQFFS